MLFLFIKLVACCMYKIRKDNQKDNSVRKTVGAQEQWRGGVGVGVGVRVGGVKIKSSQPLPQAIFYPQSLTLDRTNDAEMLYLGMNSRDGSNSHMEHALVALNPFHSW